MSLQDKASIVLPKGFAGKAGTLECWNPNSDSLVGLSLVRATTATRVNESGLIESVAANVPRRDFLNGGCGELLVEPQRTNLALHSENLSNAVYTTVNSTITINSTTSPNGTSTADTLTDDATSGQHRVTQEVAVTSGNDYTFSVFVKNVNIDFCYLLFENAFVQTRFFFDISNGTAITAGGSIVDYGNGWYRISATLTANSTSNGRFGLNMSDNGVNATYSGSGSSLYAWGFQVEQGSYATSYIPTVASTVTRNADVISGTGLAALLGDSVGGIYLRGRVFDASPSNVIEISNSSDAANERVLIDINSTNITGKTTDGGVEQATLNAAGATNNTEFAACYNYALNSFSIQKDGTTAATDSAGTTPSGLDQIRLTDGSTPFYGRISELVIFNQRPDNTQGEAVTA